MILEHRAVIIDTTRSVQYSNQLRQQQNYLQQNGGMQNLIDNLHEPNTRIFHRDICKYISILLVILEIIIMQNRRFNRTNAGQASGQYLNNHMNDILSTNNSNYKCEIETNWI